MSRFCKIGLALGGGGARGLAHLGILQELERAEISIDFLTGSSMGALVAAVYAQDPSAARAVDRFRNYLVSAEFKKTHVDFLRSPDPEEIPRWEGMFQRFASFIRKGIFYSQSLTKQAPISEENFAQNINFLLDDKNLEETAIPLAVAALDLKSCQEVVLQKGSIRKAVSASCAIPGIMPPIKIQEWELIDGGWIDRVPVRPARSMGADFVIAVDVAEELDEDTDFSTGLGIVLRTYDISRCALSRLQVEEADLIVCPDVSQVHWSDFGHLDDCVWAGAEAMREKMEEVRRRIARIKSRNFFLSPFRGKSQPAYTSG
jgi:NTE family protein